MSKVRISRKNNVQVKVGQFGAWSKVTTIDVYNDGSFDICWGQDWTKYGPEAFVHIKENETAIETDMTARELVDIVRPEHSRSSCSDAMPRNVGRCARCTLLSTIGEGKALEDFDYEELIQ